MRARIHEFLRFCIVGFTGFLVDATGLEIFVACGLPAPAARLCSMAIALQVTYVLHSLFTFRNHSGFSRKNWLHFMLLNLLGAAINYAVFLGVWSLDLVSDAQLNRQLGLVAGTAVGLCINYWSNGKFVFAKREQP